MEQATIFFTTTTYEGHAFRTQGVVDEGHHLQDLCVESMEHPSRVGDLYLAKVMDLVPSIHAAFVEIAPGVRAFLPDSDCTQAIHAGDEVLVQVTCDAIKTKDMRATMAFELGASHVCLIHGSGAHGVSKKFSKQQRKDWKGFLDDYPSDSYHLLLRTRAAACSKEDIRSEIDTLVDAYQKLLDKSTHVTCYSKLYERPRNMADALLGYVSRYQSRVPVEQMRVITDDSGLYEELVVTCASMTPALNKEQIQLYTDDSYPLYKLYSLSSQMEELTKSVVWLKSGANLLLEPMETLCAIDVNSGKGPRKKSPGGVLAQNKEAALEIGRQLRLRNLSGMILIDFINMETEEEKQELLSYMRRVVQADARKVVVVDITPLGLMELTRAKAHKSLKQTLKDC